ncbi:MAG: symmetrical bis(5'-nucleosyl)-tetraphosphatase [Burkholderiaceae bacterium]|jgi:bis(5'-nucleosyl)-tetraphosphatase (symmetrical)|nr:symmetrical bis(5'-nucleosyl)-tetraphosphatase [Burkholderiaceae bacterium]
MPVYAIGDVQGCFRQLEKLVSQLESETPAARFLFVGDLVNRGPQSLETLRFVRALGDRAVTVLGNHDLHLLAVSAGARRLHQRDTLQALLSAPDAEELLDWLRFCPLAHQEGRCLMVHAGVLPQWRADVAVSLAEEVQAVLRGDNWKPFMRDMYGDTPTRWDDALTGIPRLRCIINGLTRLRFCSAAGDMEWKNKGGPATAPAGFMPWFDVPGRKTRDVTVLFGHWSTLGLLLRPTLIGLDTGCVWGGALTAVRLADRACFQFPGEEGVAFD